jgi:hypothetical protein
MGLARGSVARGSTRSPCSVGEDRPVSLLTPTGPRGPRPTLRQLATVSASRLAGRTCSNR